MSNNASRSDFLLLEFSEVWELQILHFLVFLVLYVTTLTGNLIIIFTIAFDHHLHTPMYFFLMNLAMQDLGQISVIVPKSMMNSLMNTRHISFSGCVTQVFLFVSFIASDIFLLTAMAYDRYVAICNPFQYEMIMNMRDCIKMVGTTWISGLLYGALHTSGTFTISFCSNIVNQFFCEIPQLLKLACSDSYRIELVAVVLSIILLFGCFIFIIVTYIHIFIVVLRIPSVQGRKKAFSTCLPHLTVFSTLVFTASFAYLMPTLKTPSHLDLALSVIYSMISPLLNPLIYSMRNQEIKVGMKKLFRLNYPSNST
ncbi:PREDICTED: olfactory receptor 14A16-like [Gekko japonicus]|uniref:Olfactory receptor n=1 Tax=Gekko japonicus TaxID=146911 RepID=A0ABM1L641_GEKJA|nr:PREDICTED: olfactory receptor 14A16-like [Gekko japonicus]